MTVPRLMEVTCSRCKIQLTIPESLLGKEVRCPKCEYVFEAENEVNTATISPPDGLVEVVCTDESVNPELGEKDQCQELFYLSIPEGKEFGPVSREELDSWVREGRVSHDCRLRTNSESDWRLAIADYPMLDEGNPFANAGLAKNLMPHRGKLVLGLALLGCVIPFLSLVPAVFGTRDLRRMNYGEMDSSGDAMTRAGQAIAMVASMIWTSAFAVMLLVMLVRMMGRI